MKVRALNSVLFLVMLVCVVMLNISAHAEEATLNLPPELLNTNVTNWQLNGVTLVLAIQVLGRAFAGLKNGGGLVGIFRGIVFGTNTPKDG